MKNKTLLAGIAAAAIILLGAGGIFLFSKNQKTPTPNSTVSTEKVNPDKNSIEGSIKEIFEATGNKKCEYNVDDEESKSTGVFYVSGTKVSGEINTTKDEETEQTNIIKDGDMLYVWGDSLDEGLKMKVQTEDLSKQFGTAQKIFNPDQKISYKCSNWTVDASKFTPPTNVKFTDFSSMFKSSDDNDNVSPTITKNVNNSSECSICNSLTGAAKTACLDQFDCQ